MITPPSSDDGRFEHTDPPLVSPPVSTTDPLLQNCPAPDLLATSFDSPPPGPYPNGDMNAGLAPFRTVQWDEAPWFGWWSDGADPTHGGTYRVRWESGTHHSRELHGDLPRNVGRVYVRFDMLFESDFPVAAPSTSEHILKLLRFNGPNQAGLYGTLDYAWGAFLWHQDDNDSVGVTSDVRFPNEFKNRWMRFEVLNDAAEGRVIVWLEGQRIVDLTKPPISTQLGGIQFWGTFNSPAENGQMRLDNIAASEHCIDPNWH